MKKILLFIFFTIFICQVSAQKIITLASDTLTEYEFAVFSTVENSLTGTFYYENGTTEQIFLLNTIGKNPRSLTLNSPELALLTLKVLNYMSKKGFTLVSSLATQGIARLKDPSNTVTAVMYIFSRKRNISNK